MFTTIHDESEHLATVSSPSKLFFDNIMALNEDKPKSIIKSSDILFTPSKKSNNKQNNDVLDNKHFIKQCRSLFLKPSTFNFSEKNYNSFSTSAPHNFPKTPNHDGKIYPLSPGMTSMQNKNLAQIENGSFPDESIPTVYPFHPTNITQILHSPSQKLFNAKRKLPFHDTDESLVLQPSDHSILPFKKQKSISTISSLQTAESNHKSRFLRYYGKYPSHPALVARPFGRPSRNHSFTSDVVFDHILIFLMKSAFLDDTALRSLLRVHPLYFHLSQSISKLKFLDFRPLSRFNTEYDSQKSIPFARRMQFLACILHYNFNSSSVFRYLGNNHTNEHIQPDDLYDQLTGIVPDNINKYLHRALTTGAPSKINAHSPRNNFLDYLKYGNHKSITMNSPLVIKALNKEDKHNFVMHFPAWTARFIYNLHVSPEGILIKPNKNDRIVFDASFQIHYKSLSLNTSWTHAGDEPPIRYGTALLRHLTRIWNLRITYADEEILLWDDDVAGAFRLIKYNPDIAQAFSAIVHNTLWIPTGQVFGGNTSAQNFEGLALAREYLAQYLSTNKFSFLLHKHKKLLDLIKFTDIPSDEVSFIKAIPDTIHKGVLASTGKPINTPHNMFVDDNVIAEIRPRMKQAQAASAESLFRIAGFPNIKLRRSPLSMDKYYASTCSYLKKQLGYLINTRTMYVSFPQEKFDSMILVLQDWHTKRKSYTIKQAARLAGSLEFFASVSPWIRFLTTSLKHSILLALRKNTKDISVNKDMQSSISDSQLLGKNFDEILRKNYALSHVLRSIWSKTTRFFITKPLREEIKLLTYIFKNRSKYPIGAPIAHIIERSPDFNARGDACLEGAGGYSSDLKFWWFIEWPQKILNKTLNSFQRKYKNLKGNIVSINLLEYATIIISYAAAHFTFSLDSTLSLHPHPLINIESDNKSALSWTRRAASSTNEGKALARILTSLLITSKLGLSASFIPGVDNHIADSLSRMSTKTKFISFSSLQQEYKQLHLCKRFVPDPSFLSRLWDALLLAQAHPLQQPNQLGQLLPEKGIGQNF